MAKHTSILEAFATLSRKVDFCLQEGNIDEVLKLEDKKAKLLEDLARLNDEHPIVGAEKAAFDKQVKKLMQSERDHADRLDKLMDENRRQYRDLSKQNKSMNRFRKAYGYKEAKEGGSSQLSSQA